MGLWDWFFGKNSREGDLAFNHWDWLHLFLSGSIQMVPENWRNEEETITKIFIFQLGAMKGMADAYGFSFKDAFNGYSQVINKDIKLIEDEGALERMISSLSEQPYFQQYFLEGKNSVQKAVLERDTKASGILFELLFQEREAT